MTSVVEWLTSLKLEKYADNFISNGYDDMDYMTNITSNDLDDIGVSLPGHKKKILMSLQQHQQQQSGGSSAPAPAPTPVSAPTLAPEPTPAPVPEPATTLKKANSTEALNTPPPVVAAKPPPSTHPKPPLAKTNSSEALLEASAKPAPPPTAKPTLVKSNSKENLLDKPAPTPNKPPVTAGKPVSTPAPAPAPAPATSTPSTAPTAPTSDPAAAPPATTKKLDPSKVFSAAVPPPPKKPATTTPATTPATTNNNNDNFPSNRKPSAELASMDLDQLIKTSTTAVIERKASLTSQTPPVITPVSLNSGSKPSPAAPKPVPSAPTSAPAPTTAPKPTKPSSPPTTSPQTASPLTSPPTSPPTSRKADPVPSTSPPLLPKSTPAPAPAPAPAPVDDPIVGESVNFSMLDDMLEDLENMSFEMDFGETKPPAKTTATSAAKATTNTFSSSNDNDFNNDDNDDDFTTKPSVTVTPTPTATTTTTAPKDNSAPDFSTALDFLDFNSMMSTISSPTDTEEVRRARTMSFAALADTSDIDLDALLEDLDVKYVPPPISTTTSANKTATVGPAAKAALASSNNNNNNNLTVDLSPDAPWRRRATHELNPEEARIRKEEKIKIAMQKIAEASIIKLIIKVHTDDGGTKTIPVDSTMSAKHICEMIVKKNRFETSACWTLFEGIPKLNLERPLEDHEIVVELQQKWGRDVENVWVLRNYTSKYTLISPMTSWNPPAPELEAALYVRKGNSLLKDLQLQGWKKKQVVLRHSGIYLRKGESKASRDLVALVSFVDHELYVGLSHKRHYKAPSDYVFCLKPTVEFKSFDNVKSFCCENEETFVLWVAAIRVCKFDTAIAENREQVTIESTNTPPTSFVSAEPLPADMLAALGPAKKPATAVAPANFVIANANANANNTNTNMSPPSSAPSSAPASAPTSSTPSGFDTYDIVPSKPSVTATTETKRPPLPTPYNNSQDNSAGSPPILPPKQRIASPVPSNTAGEDSRSGALSDDDEAPIITPKVKPVAKFALPGMAGGPSVLPKAKATPTSPTPASEPETANPPPPLLPPKPKPSVVNNNNNNNSSEESAPSQKSALPAVYATPHAQRSLSPTPASSGPAPSLPPRKPGLPPVVQPDEDSDNNSPPTLPPKKPLPFVEPGSQSPVATKKPAPRGKNDDQRYINWLNKHLPRYNITELFPTITNGVFVIEALANASRSSRPNYNDLPTFPAQERENWNVLLNFMETVGLDSDDLDVESLHAGNPREISKLFGLIMSRYP